MNKKQYDFLISKERLDIHPDKQSLITTALTKKWFLYSTAMPTITTIALQKQIIIIGDCLETEINLHSIPKEGIPKMRGNFYAIYIENNSIEIYSSLFSMLPLYTDMNQYLIANSFDLIVDYSTATYVIDKKYILERLLFNYGFFNRTLYQNITLVPCHTVTLLDAESIKFKKHLDITDLYREPPLSETNVLSELSDQFLNSCQEYFPDTYFNIAFTSGFDGRTLVSCASHSNKKFGTFSFGRPDNSDVALPKEQAQKLQLPYDYLDLGNSSYIASHYSKNAKEFSQSGYHGTGYLYAHFLHSAKEMASSSKYLLSGLAGSELFRALHISGAVSSSALKIVFTADSHAQLGALLKQDPSLHVLQKEAFEKDLEELIDALWEYRDALPKRMTKNQQFYKFVFEEIFRKFFGQWVTVQQRYVNIRTPFLDYTFLKKLLKSTYAGVHNDFFTHNPLKRIKGQLLYCDIIKKTNTTLYRQKTGKGYRPVDVRNPLYNAKIFVPYIQKRLSKKTKHVNLDNLGIVSGFLSAKEDHLQLVKNHPTTLFSKKQLTKEIHMLSPFTKEPERDCLLNAVTILELINHYESKNQQKYETTSSTNRL